MAARAEIQTARLRLRPLTAEDGPALVAAIDDFAVSQWLSVVPFPYTDADFQHFLNDIAKPGSTWVIEDADGFAGVVALEKELGYWLAPRAHGLGYMTEAARAVLAGHFADTDTDVPSGYFEGNAPSLNVLTKLGFVEVGRRMNANRAQGRDLPHVDLRLTKAAFVAALPIEARSDRLTFRALQATDAEALHAIASHWDVVRQLGRWPWPPEPAFTASRATPYPGEGFSWGVFLDGTLIGTVAVTTGVLGYMLAPAHWGQGYASEACRIAVARAFVLGRDHLTAGAWSDNAASLHVLAKLGFNVAGHDVTHSIARKVDAPGHQLRLDRADWPGA